MVRVPASVGRLLYLAVTSVAVLALAACSDQEKRRVNEKCSESTDCADAVCYQGICARAHPLDDGEPCSGPGDCRSFLCMAGKCRAGSSPTGNPCLHDEECASGLCRAGKCQPAPGPDGGDAGPVDAALPDAPVPDLVKPDTTLPDAVAGDTSPCPGGCYIGLTCHAAGAISKADPCARCEPGKNKYGWSLFAGSGCVTTAWEPTSAACPYVKINSLALAAGAGKLYIARKCLLRVLDLKTGTESAVAGSSTCKTADGPMALATFNNIKRIAIDPQSSRIYLLESYTTRVRVVDLKTKVVSTLVGAAGTGCVDGASSVARFKDPSGVAVDGKGGLFVGGPCGVRRITLSPVKVTTEAAGTVIDLTLSPRGAAATAALTVEDTIKVYRADFALKTYKKLTGAGTAGHLDGTLSKARFNKLGSLDIDGAGMIYLSEYVYGAYLKDLYLRKVDLKAGLVSTIAGGATASFTDGQGSVARFKFPRDIAAASNGTLYIADGCKVRKYTP